MAAFVRNQWQVSPEYAPQRPRGISVGTYVLLMVVAKVASPHASWRAFGPWLQKTSLARVLDLPPSLLDAQNFWDAFDRILPERAYQANLNAASKKKSGASDEHSLLNDDVVLAIEQAVWQELLRQDTVDRSTLLIDATNFFTYLAQENPSRLAKAGHNKQGRHDKRQIALSMAVTRDGALPLLHLTYPGNVADAKAFPEILARLADRIRSLEPGVGELTLVFDRGHNSKSNLAAVADAHLFAVGGLILSQHPDLVALPARTARQTVGDIRVIRTHKEVYGQAAIVLVTYSDKLARKQRVSFTLALRRVKAAVWQAFRAHRDDDDERFAEAIERTLAKSRAGRYLEWEVDTDRTLHVRQRRDLAERHRREFGVRLLFTTRLDLSDSDILRLYNHDKQEVEQDFRQLKSPDLLRFSPIRHFTDTKIRLYAMVCILALLVLKVMHRRTLALGLSLEAMAQELRDIQEAIVVYSPQAAVHTLTECSTIQGQLVQAFRLREYLPDQTLAEAGVSLH